MVIAAKREAAIHKKERKESNRAIDCEFQSIQMSVDLAKQEKMKQSEAEKDAAQVEAMLARFSTATTTGTSTTEEEDEDNEEEVDMAVTVTSPKIDVDNINTKVKNIETGHVIVDSSSRSQVSTLTSALSQDATSMDMDSANDIEDVPFSKCNIFKEKYMKHMKNLSFNNDNNKKCEATV
jgi:hypothetical protein